MWAPQVITSSTPQLLIFVSNLDISACHAHETKKNNCTAEGPLNRAQRGKLILRQASKVME